MTQKNKRILVKISLWQKITLIFLGLSLFFIFLELGLRAGGFILLSLQEYGNQLSLKQKGSYRILCLGESTTALGGKDSYPSQLEEILNARNTGVNFSVINKGVPGVDTFYISDQAEYNVSKYNPDIVISMMGINDFGAHMPRRNISANKIQELFESLRIYKLARLLWLHMGNKTKDINPSVLEIKKEALSLTQDENELKKEIEKNPGNDEAYIRLGLFYISQGNLSRAAALFKKAVELNTRNDHAYIALGLLYTVLRGEDARVKMAETEKTLKRSIELNPGNDKAYIALGLLYTGQGRIYQAQEQFKKAIEIDPLNDRAYGAMAALYKEAGEYGSAKAYYKKANELRLENPDPAVSGNYLKLKGVLDKRGIKLVCVQYPMRSIKPLRKIFEGQAGVIFVDNERVFKNALEGHGYPEYFTDIFGGDFGHCTYKGNRLLAENIANVILKEVFGK